MSLFRSASAAIRSGEPTGGKPNSYGDSHRIMLPNSGIAVRVSTLWWQEDERDTRQWIAPQITAEMTFEEYHTNTDPALNAILQYTEQQSLTELLTGGLQKGGPAEARRLCREWKAVPSNKWADVEAELNDLGYHLLGEEKTSDAIAIFELNVDIYPESANAYDSLAEAYAAAGLTEQAIANYEKSLLLNPGNANASSWLAKLRGR